VIDEQNASHRGNDNLPSAVRAEASGEPPKLATYFNETLSGVVVN
jgi:hypothetical protein